eukprot:gnl/Dysnectes_brevis/4936_a6873_469.p1 GENE.gnl/Dysnectes_brevis/4936_a6873_469~~gnl/Dysnectes_brevis/4936_a6873_469.p1  ORF type:complete len:1123 (+),score=260.00 gnl/Dysnectes_brevis/4936_a6873_469:246-3371(+)
MIPKIKQFNKSPSLKRFIEIDKLSSINLLIYSIINILFQMFNFIFIHSSSALLSSVFLAPHLCFFHLVIAVGYLERLKSMLWRTLSVVIFFGRQYHMIRDPEVFQLKILFRSLMGTLPVLAVGLLFRAIEQRGQKLWRGSIKQERQMAKLIQCSINLTLSSMPTLPLATLLRGEQPTATVTQDVYIIYMSLGFGLGDSSTESLMRGAGLDINRLSLFNQFVVLCDEHCVYSGLQKIKTTGTAYLACLGLEGQPHDPLRTCATFALGAQELGRAMNISVSVGIAMGPVVSGCIGRDVGIAFDLWGEAVNQAARIANSFTSGVYSQQHLVPARPGRMSPFRVGRCVALNPKGTGCIPVCHLIRTHVVEDALLSTLQVISETHEKEPVSVKRLNELVQELQNDKGFQDQTESTHAPSLVNHVIQTALTSSIPIGITPNPSSVWQQMSPERTSWESLCNTGLMQTLRALAERMRFTSNLGHLASVVLQETYSQWSTLIWVFFIPMLFPVFFIAIRPYLDTSTDNIFGISMQHGTIICSVINTSASMLWFFFWLSVSATHRNKERQPPHILKILATIVFSLQVFGLHTQTVFMSSSMEWAVPAYIVSLAMPALQSLPSLTYLPAFRYMVGFSSLQCVLFLIHEIVRKGAAGFAIGASMLAVFIYTLTALKHSVEYFIESVEHHKALQSSLTLLSKTLPRQAIYAAIDSIVPFGMEKIRMGPQLLNPEKAVQKEAACIDSCQSHPLSMTPYFPPPACIALNPSQSPTRTKWLRCLEEAAGIHAREKCPNMDGVYQQDTDPEREGDIFVLIGPCLDKIGRQNGSINLRRPITRYEFGGVLEVDITSFTTFSSAVAPSTVLQLLDDLFSRFDHRVSESPHTLIKVKTIGDAYVVLAGSTTPSVSLGRRLFITEALCRLALNFISDMHHVLEHHGLHGILNLRCGIDVGECFTALVGGQSVNLDLFGTPSMSSTYLEGLADPGTVLVSPEVHEILLDSTHFTTRPWLITTHDNTLRVYDLEHAEGRDSHTPLARFISKTKSRSARNKFPM